jgi:hypothetical protein
MRERAELLGGSIEFLRPELGGTLIRLSVPKEVAGERSHKKVSFTESTAVENAPSEEQSKGERSHG